MAWWSSLFGRKVPSLLSIAVADQASDDTNLLTRGYKQMSIVNRCVNVIADSISTLPISGLEVLINPTLGASEIIQQIVIDYLCDEAFVEYSKAGVCTPMSPRFMSYDIKNEYYVDTFKYQGSFLSRQYFYEPKTGLHLSNDALKTSLVRIYNPDPEARLEPSPILKTLAMEITMLEAARKWNLNLLLGGGNPSFVFSTPDKLSKADLDVIGNTIDVKLADPRRKGKPLMLFGGLVPHKIGMSPEEMGYQTLLSECSKSIATAFGVPLPLLFDDAATYNNREAAKIQFYTETVLPLATLILAQLSKLVGKELKVDEGRVETVVLAREKRIRGLVELLKAGVLDEAQVAAELGYDA